MFESFESRDFSYPKKEKEEQPANIAENINQEQEKSNEKWMKIVDEAGKLEGVEQKLWSKYVDYAKQAEVLHEHLDSGAVQGQNTESMFSSLRSSMGMEDLEKQVGADRAAELETLATEYLDQIKKRQKLK